MKKRSYSLLVTVIALFILLWTVVYIRQTKLRLYTTPENIQKEGTIKVSPTDLLNKTNNLITIIFPDGKTVRKENFAASAYEALQNIAKENNLQLKTKQYDFGIMVTGIGQYENGKLMYWIYEVNGKTPPLSADKYVINSGDIINWKYSKAKITTE